MLKLFQKITTLNNPEELTVVFFNPISSSSFLWVLRSYAMYHTGVIAISLMGLVIALSSRPL